MFVFKLQVECNGTVDQYEGDSLAACVRELVSVAAAVPEQFPDSTLADVLDGLAALAQSYADSASDDEFGERYSATSGDAMSGDVFNFSLSVA